MQITITLDHELLDAMLELAAKSGAGIWRRREFMQIQSQRNEQIEAQAKQAEPEETTPDETPSP